MGRIELNGDSLAVDLRQLGHQAVGVGAAGLIGEDDVDALGGQVMRHAAAQAAAAAGDQCDFHVRAPLCAAGLRFSPFPINTAVTTILFGKSGQ